MKKLFLISICLLLSYSLAEKKNTATSIKTFKGTWCTGEDGMVLTFAGKDSLHVSSKSDETVGGSGKYTRDDTTFAATLTNGDMALKMKYRYRWKGTDTVEAKAMMFTINEEAVEYPQEWMSMVRCGEKKK